MLFDSFDGGEDGEHSSVGLVEITTISVTQTHFSLENGHPIQRIVWNIQSYLQHPGTVACYPTKRECHT